MFVVVHLWVVSDCFLMTYGKEYTKGKQTYKQLALKHGCSARTIQRKIDSVGIKQEKSFEFLANVLI